VKSSKFIEERQKRVKKEEKQASSTGGHRLPDGCRIAAGATGHTAPSDDMSLGGQPTIAIPTAVAWALFR